MRHEMTNYQLMILDDDIKAKSKEPAFFYLLKSKTDAFYKQNKMVLKILRERIQEIKLKHCSKNEDGSPLVETIEPGKQELVYPSEEAKKASSEELTEFLNRSIYVEI